MTDKISGELLADLMREAANEDWEDLVLALTELQSLRSAQAGEVEVDRFTPVVTLDKRGLPNGAEMVIDDVGYWVHLNAHKSVIAAKDAELYLLRNARDNLEQAWDEANSRAEAAEQQVRDMRAGLEFYRDGFKFTTNPRYGGLEWKPTETLLDDCGNTARLLLKEGGE